MDIEREYKRSLERILTGLDLSGMSKREQAVFIDRLNEQFPRLFALLVEIYGQRYDFFYYLQQLAQTLANGFAKRSNVLKQKDNARLAAPHWYQDENMLGMACYVDLFAGDLKGLQQRIPYLVETGITYLHLMPLYDSPKGDSDGGYAVSDYRKVNDTLGSNKDLEELSKALAEAGISLVLDFVFNHTSDEHPWALAAKAGDQKYQEFYYMFDDKHVPDEYEKHLREIFPQVRRGNFSWDSDSNKWVWTTFNNFQWDLNYTNPAVFNAITDEMLYLANLGCEALRLDALAFIWKEMGTNCENQAKAHSLIQAFNSCLQIAAPAVVFKSEAIVHPDEVLKYIDKQECQLSYNPLLMALIWNTLATRDTHLLTESMQKSFEISPDCAWVNYVRCHDDIGWTFDDAVAGQQGVNGYDHRRFLNQFYTGRFEGSFATGVAFGENPSNGDCRVCGSLASLAGLEQGIEQNNATLIEHAVARILMVHSIILSIGGIPLIYSGDELALLNDYRYEQDDSKKHDERWVQRIPVTDADIQASKKKDTPQNRVATGLQTLIGLRKQYSVFGQASTRIITPHQNAVFAYQRTAKDGTSLLAICNFSEHKQRVSSITLGLGNGDVWQDLLSSVRVSPAPQELELAPYQVMWLLNSQPV
ncbi:MAG: alpha-amylase family glycosyl hydrolase [Paraglaciecola chathamensis]